MPLTLSTVDERRIEALSSAMLSPLDYEDPGAWCEAISRQVKVLLGADAVGAMIPLEDRYWIWSNKPEGAEQYSEKTEILDGRLRFLARAVDLGAYDRATLFRPVLEEYLRSPYYHEYIVPHRSFDGIGLAVSLTGGTSVHDLAQVLLHHEEDRSLFGPRGPAILRLLLPSFRAGALAWVRFARERETLAATLDELGEPLLLCDGQGRLLHANKALERLLGSEGDRATLQATLEDFARGLATARRGWAAGAPSMRPDREVRTPEHAYRLYGSYAAEGLLSRGRIILVGVERLTVAWPAESRLRERFGLTGAQARVALLVAKGKTNDEIARELVISPATARNHTARIREKLGVSSRAKVSAVILEGGPGGHNARDPHPSDRLRRRQR